PRAQYDHQIAHHQPMASGHTGYHHDTASGEFVPSLIRCHPSDEGRLVHAEVGLDVHRNLISFNFTANRTRKEGCGPPSAPRRYPRSFESIGWHGCDGKSSHQQWAEASLPTHARRAHFY